MAFSLTTMTVCVQLCIDKWSVLPSSVH